MSQCKIFMHECLALYFMFFSSASFYFVKYSYMFRDCITCPEDRHLPMNLKRKVFNQCVLPAMTYGCQTWSLTKGLVRKLEISQRAMERKMLYVKLWDRIRNIIIRQRTRVTDVVQYITNTKWKLAGYITQMKDNRWTVRSTEWQKKGVRSVERPKRRKRDDIVGQQGAEWTRIAKDRKSWRTLAEGYFLQWKLTA